MVQFADTFWTPYSDYEAKIGQTFKVLGTKGKDTYDFEDVGVMYVIQLQDGTLLEAFPEEVKREQQLF